jgi:hypothetical protein
VQDLSSLQLEPSNNFKKSLEDNSQRAYVSIGMVKSFPKIRKFLLHFIDTDMQSSTGNSGGPILNQDGELVGVLFGSRKESASFFDIDHVIEKLKLKTMCPLCFQDGGSNGQALSGPEDRAGKGTTTCEGLFSAH